MPERKGRHLYQKLIMFTYLAAFTCSRPKKGGWKRYCYYCVLQLGGCSANVLVLGQIQPVFGVFFIRSCKKTCIHNILEIGQRLIMKTPEQPRGSCYGISSRHFLLKFNNGNTKTVWNRFKGSNKDTKTTRGSLLLIWINFTPYSNVSIVCFKQLNADWVYNVSFEQHSVVL